jgi:lipopolysaccharide transport system permease protein
MIVGSLFRHWDLVVQLTKRDVMGRYRGSAMGVFWAVGQPVIMLAVYLVVFHAVFTPFSPIAQTVLLIWC